MSTDIPFHSSITDLPRQLLVTLPEFEVPGCPESKLLAGDYVLERLVESANVTTWGVSFPSIAGFSRVNVIRESSGSDFEMSILLSGSTPAIVWKTQSNFSSGGHLNLSAEETDKLITHSIPQARLCEIPFKENFEYASNPSSPLMNSSGPCDVNCLWSGRRVKIHEVVSQPFNDGVQAG